MGSSNRYIAKLNDRDVIRAFENCQAKYAEQSATLVFGDHFGELQTEDVIKFKDLHGFFLNHAILRIGNCSWQWTRLRADANNPNGAQNDTLTLHWDDRQRPERAFTAAVSSTLDDALSRPLAVIGKNNAGATLASHSEILLAMESIAAKVLTDAVDHRKALEDAYLQKDETLNIRFEELRERELERIKEEKGRVNEELNSRKESLDERQSSLDTLQKTLDDRNNTHVRRDIRSSLMQLTKERLANFSVSNETRFQYFAVHIVSIFGFLFLSYASIYFGSKIIIDPKTLTYASEAMALAIKSALFATTAIALGSWYLRWLNRWLQRIADAEFKLQQFRLDIERASWLAETVLEWKATSPEPFPDLLASRLSAGLFQSSSTEIDDPRTPAAHLAEALLGAASTAKLKLGEQELTLDRRGINKLDK